MTPDACRRLALFELMYFATLDHLFNSIRKFINSKSTIKLKLLNSLSEDWGTL